MNKYCMLIVTLLAAHGPANAASKLACPDGSGPRTAVMGYLTAMHENRFADAYDFVTTGMTDGRERAEWATLQERAYGPGKVQIYGVDPRRAMVAGDDLECAAAAVVPNILSSRDRLNEHGSVELEIYFVVKEDAGWRISAQETLFENDAMQTWFPDVELLDPAASE
jgi:hypothetical protein